MQRRRVLRLVPQQAPEQSAKVITLQSRRAGRLERLNQKQKPTRPDAA